MLPPTAPLSTRREDLLARLKQDCTYDLAVVGGGSTGLGVALDAAARGLKVVLLESHDFAKGTSSRSTKLVHGGVRYLGQGNIALVREALHERTTLLRNAPHLAQPLAFVVPSYHWWNAPFYGAGLTMYDMLAGKAGLGNTRFLGPRATAKALPTVRLEGLQGGVQYWDGQFNDAKLALALARTAASLGALLVNYCGVKELLYAQGKVCGLVAQDAFGGQDYQVHARCVVNATGVWVDTLRQLDKEAHIAAGGRAVKPMLAPSQGVHIVVDREFLPAETALMVPKTSDGRVLFAVPWLGKVILGTTDTPRHDLAREPLAFAEEVEFILRESARYLRTAPTRSDIKSIWVGLRPLVKPPEDEGERTQALSREHTVIVSRSNLVTVTGGKWTTYRAMAEDVLAKCEARGLIDAGLAGRTVSLKLVGAYMDSDIGVISVSAPEGLHCYGIEAALVEQLPGNGAVLAGNLTEAMVRFAARYEYAVTVEDVLARRFRTLFLDARLAQQLSARVAAILREETGLDPKEADFLQLAKQYLQIP
jgi:glycerol-3-phosphate dehydrogenase